MGDICSSCLGEAQCHNIVRTEACHYQGFQVLWFAAGPAMLGPHGCLVSLGSCLQPGSKDVVVEAESTVTRLVPQVDIAALARIVKDLVAGGRACMQDGVWLEERIAAAGLGRHESDALVALRDGLRLDDRSLFDTIPAHWV